MKKNKVSCVGAFFFLLFNLINLFYLFSLTACSEPASYVPVVDISHVEQIERIPKNGLYVVSPGDTLYSIAWRYGLDYRYLAGRNHIQPPYAIQAGQKLYLKGQSKAVNNTVILRPISSWSWPVRGEIIGQFSALNKGINIGGEAGEPIVASASGQVVYCGNGLRGYGNLIIIKHNNLYLTAYAHNKINLVREGQWVKQNQLIGRMGNTESRTVMLHFEIRRGGQPVNPLGYLTR